MHIVPMFFSDHEEAEESVLQGGNEGTVLRDMSALASFDWQKRFVNKASYWMRTNFRFAGILHHNAISAIRFQLIFVELLSLIVHVICHFCNYILF